MEVFPLPFVESDCLFFHPQHLRTQTEDVIYSFILTSDRSSGILASFNCTKCSGGWVSPPMAPFGGILLQNGCSKNQLRFFLACIREWLQEHGASRLTIKTAPVCYYPDMHALCHECYVEAGFLLNHTYSNHYIPIGNDSFYQLIERTERRRLVKGKAAGFEVCIQQGIMETDSLNFLRNCYAGRKYEQPLSSERLSKFAALFPDSFLSFRVTDHGKLIAVAIAVIATPRVLYHFMSAYLSEYSALSPALLLFEAMYGLGQKRGFSVLDLGISIDNLGNAKTSLSRFKTNIGGMECPKIIYEAVF